MKKRMMLTFFALMVTALLSVSAMAQLNTHSVWTDDNGLVIGDAENGCEYSKFDKFHMATSWTERTRAILRRPISAASRWLMDLPTVVTTIFTSFRSTIRSAPTATPSRVTGMFIVTVVLCAAVVPEMLMPLAAPQPPATITSWLSGTRPTAHIGTMSATSINARISRFLDKPF